MGRGVRAGGERGIYRSADGGATWQRTLHVNDTTGASDVAIDPQDPNIVYAGMYDYLRQPWAFRSGGPGSGLYRSADGGLTWKKLTDPSLQNGLPGAKLIGRIGLSIHRKDPRVVYALIEAQEAGVLWRSDDRGERWRVVSSERRINNRPFYYTQVRADPVDPDRVYTLSGSFNVSTDGGRTFGPSGGRMFGDHHALWIDPTNPQRLLSGTDGGFFISNDFGRNWDFVNNMPMAQAYHVGIDMAEPYNILGGFQDHEIWRGPNEKWNQVGVREGDWLRLRYMADGMYTLADPRDPNLVYYNGHFGDITRLDMRTQEERYIQPYPPGPAGGGADLEKYRFNWNSPVLMSPSNPDVLYYGGNVLFKTADRGETWSIISPDLTTNDKEKQRSSGGPISTDNTRAEFHCTIVSLAESPRDPSVIWAGTDDGNLQITRDGGKTWKNVAPKIPDAPRSLVVLVDLGLGRRARDRIRHDRPAPARRLRAVRICHDRLRRHLEEDLGRAARIRSHRARGSEAAAAALRRHRAWHLGVLRPRRLMAGFAARSSAAGGGRHESASTRQRSRHRDTRARVLRPRRHHAAAEMAPGQAGCLDALGPGKPASTESATVGAGLAGGRPRCSNRCQPSVIRRRATRACWAIGCGSRAISRMARSSITTCRSGGPRAADDQRRAGRKVQRVGGPGEAGLNRAVWNLSERSSCAVAQSRRKVVDVDAVERGAEEAPGCERCRANTRCR